MSCVSSAWSGPAGSANSKNSANDLKALVIGVAPIVFPRLHPLRDRDKCNCCAVGTDVAVWRFAGPAVLADKGQGEFVSDKTLTSDELLALRHRLDKIDDSIIDLIAERQAVVTTIGEHKLATGAPLRHYEREREVIDRGMERAENKGISIR